MTLHGIMVYGKMVLPPFLYIGGIIFCTNINTQVKQFIFLLVLDMKVDENKESPDLLSFPLRFVCGLSHAGVNYSTNSALNLVRVLYFGIFFKKLYLL
jgi:hypothetical protein